MPKIVRNTILALLALVIVLMITLFVIANRIDPNDYKPQIIEQTRLTTGLELSLDGDISWSFFPSVAISLNDIEAHTQKAYVGDTLFAKINQVAASVPLMPLLRRQIEVDNVLLSGIELRLATDKNSHSNWKDIERDHSHTSKHSDDDSTEYESGSHENRLLLKNLSLKNIAINIIDASTATNQSLRIDNLRAKNLNLHGAAFPLELALKLEDQTQSIAVNLTSNVALDTATQSYELSNISGALDKARFSGSAKVLLGKQTQVNANLDIGTLDLNDYVDFQAARDAQEVEAAPASEADIEIPLDILHTLNTNLSLSISKLIADQTLLEDLQLTAKIDNGYLDMSNLSANVYEGTVKQSLQINANRNPARWTAKQSLHNINTQQLLTSRDIDINFAGLASLESDVSFSGESMRALQQSLAGTTTFSLSQGSYGDDNIERRICQAIALSRNERLGTAWPADSTLNDIKTNIQWSKGVGKITSLTAGLPNASLVGDGSINLLEQSLDLRLRANVSGDISKTDPACEINERYRDIQWPIRCKGDADSSSCGVDNSRLDKILSSAVKAKAQEKLEEKINEKLGEELGNTLRGLFK